MVEKSLWRNVDNFAFGKDFDFERPFFPQFLDLLRETYKPSLIQSGVVVQTSYPPGSEVKVLSQAAYEKTFY